MNNATVPGQNGNTSVYAPELTQIARALQAWAAPRKTKLMFGLTSPMICNLSDDGCVVNLNNQVRRGGGREGEGGR
jgi:hypothetical protein